MLTHYVLVAPVRDLLVPVVVKAVGWGQRAIHPNLRTLPKPFSLLESSSLVQAFEDEARVAIFQQTVLMIPWQRTLSLLSGKMPRPDPTLL